jgi:hypothetical protein
VIGLTELSGLVFCTAHRHPELHGCTFDWKRDGAKKLAEALPKVSGGPGNSLHRMESSEQH